MHFHFIGDFSKIPGRTEMTGDREKQNFIARYYHGEKLSGALLCNRRNAEVEIEAITQDILKSHPHK
jgi:hypothetical protein